MKPHINDTHHPLGEQLVTDERGLSTVEYVIVLALIAVAAIGIWSQFGKTIITKVGAADVAFSAIPMST